MPVGEAVEETEVDSEVDDDAEKPGGEDEQGAEDQDKLGWQWQEAFLLLPLYQNAAVGDREEAQDDRKYKECERYFQIHRDCGLRF